MSRRWYSIVLPLAFAASVTAQQPAASTATTPKQFTAADLEGWKNIRATTLSADGKWLAYQLAPNEGDASVIVRPTGEGKELRFAIGEPPSGGGGNPFGAAPPSPALTISGDSKWVAFMVYPSKREAARLRRDRRPAQNKVALVNVATGEKKEFDKVRRFAFNGDKPRWLAMHGYTPDAAPAGPAAGAGAPAAGAAAGAAREGRSDGADLLLYDLTSGDIVNVGNVSEFGFDDSGEWLAYAIDARDRIGNGVQL